MSEKTRKKQKGEEAEVKKYENRLKVNKLITREVN